MKKNPIRLIVMASLLALPVSAYALRRVTPRLVPPQTPGSSILAGAGRVCFSSTDNVKGLRLSVRELPNEIVFELAPHAPGSVLPLGRPALEKPAYVELRHTSLGLLTTYQLANVGGSFFALVPRSRVMHPLPQDFGLFAWPQGSDWTEDEQALLRLTFEGVELH